MEDFDKVTKIKRSITVDTTEQDREIRDLKNKSVFTLNSLFD